jgi:anti-sigma-K factor RskA
MREIRSLRATGFMKRYSTRLLEALALDDALGLLHGSAACRYEKYLQRDEAGAEARRLWRLRSMRLLGAVAPRAPPRSLLETLRRRLEESAHARG